MFFMLSGKSIIFRNINFFYRKETCQQLDFCCCTSVETIFFSSRTKDYIIIPLEGRKNSVLLHQFLINCYYFDFDFFYDSYFSSYHLANSWNFPPYIPQDMHDYLVGLIETRVLKKTRDLFLKIRFRRDTRMKLISFRLFFQHHLPTPLMFFGNLMKSYFTLKPRLKHTRFLLLPMICHFNFTKSNIFLSLSRGIDVLLFLSNGIFRNLVDTAVPKSYRKSPLVRKIYFKYCFNYFKHLSSFPLLFVFKHVSDDSLNFFKIFWKSFKLSFLKKKRNSNFCYYNFLFFTKLKAFNKMKTGKRGSIKRRLRRKLLSTK